MTIRYLGEEVTGQRRENQSRTYAAAYGAVTTLLGDRRPASYPIRGQIPGQERAGPQGELPVHETGLVPILVGEIEPMVQTYEQSTLVCQTKGVSTSPNPGGNCGPGSTTPIGN